jgi:hypothetical protein
VSGAMSFMIFFTATIVMLFISSVVDHIFYGERNSGRVYYRNRNSDSLKEIKESVQLESFPTSREFIKENILFELKLNFCQHSVITALVIMEFVLSVMSMIAHFLLVQGVEKVRNVFVGS